MATFVAEKDHTNIMLIMKKTFTKLFSTVSLLSLLFIGQSAHSQTVLAAANTNAPATTVANDSQTEQKADDKKVEKKDEPAAWTPTRRLWGYAFGDLYYAPHAAANNLGGETMYNGVPANRNAFQFRRLYLGYDYDINQKFSAEVLLASEPNANTGIIAGTGTNTESGDNLADNRMAFYIKNFNLRIRDLWKGTDLVFGEMSTPGFALNTGNSNAPSSLSEATWSYRFIEKTITDFHKNNSYDVGAALQGTFDPATKNYGYVFMVGNNTTANLTSAANANTGFYKIFYGDLWGKFLEKHLYIDVYADYAKTGPSIPAAGPQEHNMFKAFVAYTVPQITVGVEAYTQKIANSIGNTTTGKVEDATVNGLSVFARGPIVKDKWGWFARYDGYNPDTKFNNADTYATTFNTNYGNYTPFIKETFYTAGFDYTPAPKIHFSPNVWIVNYKDQRNSTAAGFVKADHTVVLRATVYYTFGK